LGEIPAGSLNLSQRACGSQGKNAQETRHFEQDGRNSPANTLNYGEIDGESRYLEKCLPSGFLRRHALNALRRAQHSSSLEHGIGNEGEEASVPQSSSTIWREYEVLPLWWDR